MKQIIPLFLFPAFLFFSGCGRQAGAPIEIEENTADSTLHSATVTLTQAQMRMAGMKLGNLQPRDFSERVHATGMLEVPVKHHIRLSAYGGGYVKHIDLLPGQRVRRGQLLFTIENPEFVSMQQQYLEASAQLAFLQSDYERQKTLANENIASQKKLLQAEMDYQRTLARVEGLRHKLQLLRLPTEQLDPAKLRSTVQVYAPENGFITQVYATQGMYLNPTDVVVEMVNTDHLHLELHVFEKDILKVETGQPLRFYFPDAGMETFAGEVHLIGKEVDPEKRTVQLHGHIEDEEAVKRFVPGMFVEADIITQKQQVMALPETALVADEEGTYVWVKKEEQGEQWVFEKMAVITGINQDGWVEIRNAADFQSVAGILVEGAFQLQI